jgi:hypothetical protein
LIAESTRQYPDVEFKYCEAIEGFRRVLWPNGVPEDPLELQVKYFPWSSDDVPHIEVITKKGKVFGPQPFLAIETSSRRFIHDNFDFSPSLDKWYYAFHSDTLPVEDVTRIGIAANDLYGNTCIKNLELNNRYETQMTV